MWNGNCILEEKRIGQSEDVSLQYINKKSIWYRLTSLSKKFWYMSSVLKQVCPQQSLFSLLRRSNKTYFWKAGKNIQSSSPTCLWCVNVMTLIGRWVVLQPGWAVQSTAKKRHMPVYKEVIKERLHISGGEYFSPWAQCSFLTYIPPQHSNADSLREGCKVLPDDFPKGQVNHCFPSITGYILWADPAATPTSVPKDRYVCQCQARAADTSSFST